STSRQPSLMSDDGYSKALSQSDSEDSSSDSHENDAGASQCRQTTLPGDFSFSPCASSPSSSVSNLAHPSNPSLLLPVNPQAQDSRIRKGPHQPSLVRYVNFSQWKT
uniref:Uncharacterized protein n=1 Tax=Amphimedon queenslandica TaxID=400682 RepID=A0A1X7VK17_AMPQE